MMNKALDMDAELRHTRVSMGYTMCSTRAHDANPAKVGSGLRFARATLPSINLGTVTIGSNEGATGAMRPHRVGRVPRKNFSYRAASYYSHALPPRGLDGGYARV